MSEKKQKKYAFFFHYNKPATQRAGKIQVTVHFRQQCILVDDIVFDGPIQLHTKSQDTQPRWTVRGQCTDVQVESGVAHIIP